MFLVAVIISHLTKRIRDQADARARPRAAHRQPLRHQPGARPRPFARRAARRRPSGTCARSSARASPCSLPGADGKLEAARAEAEGARRAPTRTWESPSGHGSTSGPRARRRTRCPRRARSSCRSRVRAGASACSALYPSPAPPSSATPTSGSSSRRSRGSSARRSSARQLADEARRARLRAETEQLRNSLLSSVSHDLRTPLAVVTGATSALLDEHGPKDEAARRELLRPRTRSRSASTASCATCST